MLEISAFYEGTTKEQAKYNKCKQEIEEIFILAGRVHEWHSKDHEFNPRREEIEDWFW